MHEAKPAGFIAVKSHVEIMWPMARFFDDATPFDEGAERCIEAKNADNRAFPQMMRGLWIGWHHDDPPGGDGPPSIA
jgi:hypothetical protein